MHSEDTNRSLDIVYLSRTEMELYLLERGWLIRKTQVPHFKDFGTLEEFIGIGLSVNATRKAINPVDDEYQLFQLIPVEQLKQSSVDVIEFWTNAKVIGWLRGEAVA